MNEHRITFTRSARKELEELPAHDVAKIFSRIEKLASHPRPGGCRKIQGEQHLWRIRIGDYRVIYAVDDSDKWIDIIAIRHRKDAYR